MSRVLHPKVDTREPAADPLTRMSLGQRILEAVRAAPARRVILQGLLGSSRAFAAASLVAEGRLPVIVAEDSDDAERIYRDLAFLLGTDEEEAPKQGVLFFGADEKSPYESHSPDPRAVMERISTLYRLSRESTNVRAIVLTPRALAKKHVAPALFARAFEYLVAGEALERDKLLARLVEWGYNSVSTVEDPGTFSVRGGIIDVYSPYLPVPVRLDLFGDEIESLRTFDPSTQRTTAELEDVIILPAREIVLTDDIVARAAARIEELAEHALVPSRRLRAVIEDLENRIHFFGIESLLPLFHREGLVPATAYLPRGDHVLYLVGDRAAMEKTWDEVVQEAQEGQARAELTHELALPWEEHVTAGGEVLDEALRDQGIVELPQVLLTSDTPILRVESEETEAIRGEIMKATRIADADADLLEPLTRRLRRWRSAGFTNLLVCHTRGQAERLKSLLEPKNLQVRLRADGLRFEDLFPKKGERSAFADRSVHAFVVLGDISGGFVLPSAQIALVTEEELFGQRMRRRRTRKPAAGAFVSDLAELKPGDYVVHLEHGIGLYHGMARFHVGGVDQDFLHIEYKGGDKLYLPVHRLRMVQKYASAEEGKQPHLSKLGSPSWGNTKRKVKDTLLKMAAGLLRLYAVREALEGHALPAPTEKFTEFEAEFAFEPTPDQQKAISDVIRDLQSSRPMDRLICGDVGYGKTEVAMRAAMLAVLGQKQVAVLVPTTVLAAQHYQVFSERFANFPVRIGIVSRFQTRDDTKRTLRDLAEGRVDIVIGTHRILSKDVQFKDLGLLVIDEEHRFGVVHKERLKQYRAKVHVLTLSATPIPRTMHMGMMGVRDMSIIATPPVDRLAVKTEVSKFSEEVIRDAVLKEIRRGGQCFVVHNRVASIDAFGRMLGKLVPEARIAIGHGQMDEEALEKVMVDFMNKQSNVLLSTTIIESGIDISSANTIIINRADRLGLAQLYQLRGRVGRSRVRGFAHFLIPPGSLSKDARKRIGVLQRFTELGAGFKVASHDLEIRGAGNLLGQQQSGSITAVGFEMYQALLNEAIEELKGKQAKSYREPEIQLPVPALIPDSYIPTPGERLSYYQRLNAADTDETTYDVLQEMTDLYGTPPAEVENLAQLMLVKQRLSRLGGLGLDFGAQTKTVPPRIVIRFDNEQPGISPAQLVKYIERRSRDRKLIPDGRLLVHLVPFEDVREILQQTKDQLDELLITRISREQ